jgi:hypothetical protein
MINVMNGDEWNENMCCKRLYEPSP